jgi:hypothetical protein
MGHGSWYLLARMRDAIRRRVPAAFGLLVLAYSPAAGAWRSPPREQSAERGVPGADQSVGTIARHLDEALGLVGLRAKSSA